MIYLIISLLAFTQYSLSFSHFIQEPFPIEKYSIDYIPLNHWESEILANSTALNLGKIISLGKDSDCYIPNYSFAALQKIGYFQNYNIEKKDDENLDSFLRDNLNDAIEILRKQFSNNDHEGSSCINYPNGFWTYQFCSGNSINQIHFGDIIKNDEKLNFTLGNTNEEFEKRDHKLLYDTVDGYYISESISNGDICDLTGMPRSTEVHYSCGPSTDKVSIELVQEQKTCNYILKVSVNELCSLDIYKEQNQELSDPHFNSPISSSALTSNSGNIKSMVCVVKHEKPKLGILDVIEDSKPIFLGYGFYFLTDKNENSNNRLIYTGSSENLQKNLGFAVDYLVTEKYIKISNDDNDEFTWNCDIINIKHELIDKISLVLNDDALIGFKNLGLN
ncbi:hypothetical protein Kpol_1065p42 [Vanderwaltozyma polyspora DSM 70294]|uniref:Endoplasmic reticulum lectin n=1 Tax=Vanderwaltozyma polyspora (strain ATCC 22028 / DSM 70294 / BCRC 21397 / CBS 2163 / NBRC 10782 / NRRL Y-8283 / UCD 57-17) TaxID=436907 RepID=A7TL63_VANPO|nr:uncharacterized protein Kpol_1065p42 [Vanderwaltozyma polyspora DSM 70294]EDO17026.1 hypothetical protein Kpol_1065p42 [Vanderwaltozyma polyspora DSM 70294]